MANVVDRWHRSRPQPGELLCAEHGKVPTVDHGKGKRWLVRYRDSLGAQRNESFVRRPAADNRAKAIGGDELRGLVVSPAAGRVSFRVYAEDHRGTRRHDLPTADRYERMLRRHVYPVIGDRSLAELAARPSLLSAWIAGLTVAPSTAQRIVRDVSGVFAAAVEDGAMGRNPLAGRSIRETVRRLDVPQEKPVPWTTEQVAAVAGALPGRYAILPWLGAGTGARQGELFGLSADDVAFLGTDRAVHVRRQVRLLGGSTLVYSDVKNRKPHQVPLADSLGVRLAEHMRRYPPTSVTLPWREPDGEPVTHRLLLTRPDGRAMHRTNFNDAWRVALASAGVPVNRRNGCHILRHSAASAWLSAGVGLAEVAAYLGDSVAVVASTYSHLVPGTEDRARQAIDEYLAGKSSARNVHGEAADDA